MNKTILVVDDSSTNREIIKKLLGDEYRILEAASGAAAVAMIRAQGSGLSAVLLDLVMPVMDGFAVLEYLRGDDSLPRLPVLVTTGQNDRDAEVRALSLGAADYLSKPYHSAVIRRRVGNMIALWEATATVTQLQRDELTKFYKREVFFDKSMEMIARRPAGYYVMASFNIDGFKVINDQYGTEVGDSVLRHVAGCLDGAIHPLGGLCCRMTADHFAVLYPFAALDTAALSRCRERCCIPPVLSTSISVRIGFYVITDLTISASAMYDRASIAETSAKGRYDVKLVQYDESMRLHILREQSIVTEMGSALAEGQFEAWFQPQFNHATGALIGSEALARWRHPTRGLLPPGEFIPVFERNGFIYELDKYIWKEACRCLRKWLDQGLDPLPVAVNISRYDPFRPDLLENILRLVKQYRIPTKLLRLEITESAFAGTSDCIIDIVETLGKEGFIIEIDDFGSGYSSLNTLKDVPADVLKLDMSFLERGRTTERGGNILASIVRMAHWLGMDVIAEGVETIEQAEYLRSIGCTHLQGFLYAKPMPEEEYEVFVSAYDKEQETLTLELLDHMNHNTFWDPNSLDTLIFNSYVGGACILEYNDGAVELLRYNNRYMQELAAPHLSPDDFQALQLDRYMDQENQEKMMACIKTAITAGGESVCELCLVGLSGPGVRTDLRFALRVIAAAGVHRLLYGTIHNLTPLREAQRKEREADQLMRTVLDDAPGGFFRAQVYPDHTLQIAYVNDGFCRLVGMEREEYMVRFGTNALAAVHPADRQAVQDAYRNRGPGEDEFQLRCRLYHSTRGYVPISLFGRVVHTECGETFLNTYQTDISQQLALEVQRQDLLDHLPCGAVLYRLTHGEFRAMHLNRRYCELVGRSDPSPLAEAVHPQDLGPLMEAFSAAVADRRDFTATIRLLYGHGQGEEYRAFRIRVRVEESGGEDFLVYVTVVPLSEL